MCSGLLIILLSFLIHPAEQTITLSATCQEALEDAERARKDRKPLVEMKILEDAVKRACTGVSKAHSQLSLCYLEAGDRSYSDRGEKDNDKRRSYFEKALSSARFAAQLDSTNKYAFEHQAMAFAGILDVNGLRDKVQLADSVRINAEKALELDPDNDRALHILGRWHYEVSRFGGFLRFLARLFFGTAPEASLDMALVYFQRAADLDDYPVHHYWLGLTHLEMKDHEKAQYHFTHILEIENQHHNDEYFKNQAREHLNRL